MYQPKQIMISQLPDLTVQTLDEKTASERLQTLYRVNTMLKQVEADGLQMSVVLPRILGLAVKQLDADDGSIVVVNKDLELEHAWLNSLIAGKTISNTFLEDIMSRGLAGQVIRSQEPAIIGDTLDDERWLARPEDIETNVSRSVICTPFIVRDRAIGAITIHKRHAHQFDDRDLDLLTAISNQAASTIENARLFEEKQRQLQISALLHDASRIINSSLDINEIMQSLLTQMNEFLNAEALSIALVDKQSNELVYQVGAGAGSDKIVGLRLPANQGVSGWVMTHNRPVLVADTANDPRFYAQGDKRTGHATLAMICAPMQFKGEVLGTIQAINPIQGAFTHEDLNLLVNLANIASSAIANAQQYARTQAAEARYMRLFQDSVDPIILTDLKGNLVDANQRAVAFLGYRRSVLLSKNVADLYPGDGNAHLLDVTRLQTDEVRIFNSLLINREGQGTHVEVYVKRTQYGDHEFIQWIYHDISKHVELEEMRQDLTAMLFHDLQSPLGNVISSLELLSIEIGDQENTAVDIMLEIATRSSQRLQTLVRSLLDIDRFEAGQPLKAEAITETNILDMINEVHDIEQPNLEKRNITLITSLEDNLPTVYVDADMIRRVFINLVDNALKYSEESQEIAVSVQCTDNPNYVLVSVSDQGEGIPTQYRKSIFDKFQRIKREGSTSKGLGLGLAFCRLAVEAHHGRIWVDDAPSGGARFNFTLPARPHASLTS